MRTTLSPAAEITPLLAGPSLTVWLHWLNPTPQSVVQTVPAGFACRLANAGQRFESRLELRTTAEAGEVTIPPGGFVWRE